MRSLQIVLSCLFMIPLFLSPACASEEVKGLLQKNVDQVLAILQDPSLKGDENKAARREKLSSILEAQFDYKEMSKRALGRPWRDLDKAQRMEFTELFGQLLKNTYIEKLEKYTNEKITYDDTRTLNEKKVVVETTITSQGNEYPIHYSMITRGEGWMCYDVNIEGVGLISNYRSQFKKTISKEGYDALVEKLKEKVAE